MAHKLWPITKVKIRDFSEKNWTFLKLFLEPILLEKRSLTLRLISGQFVQVELYFYSYHLNKKIFLPNFFTDLGKFNKTTFHGEKKFFTKSEHKILRKNRFEKIEARQQKNSSDLK